MAYSELIKNFDSIREYIRDFYVYGFKSRTEYTKKSARSYDNERRRIESWLSDYVSFHKTKSGKNVFLSVDSRQVEHNPLFKVFKTKSFTPKDITFHFYILDFLRDNGPSELYGILDGLTDVYGDAFDIVGFPDESTTRKKLNELIGLGLVRKEKNGKKLVYSLVEEKMVLSDDMRDAIDFYSEMFPVGVIGSFLLDKLPEQESIFRFKHHYLMNVIDSEIMCRLLIAISDRKPVTVRSIDERKKVLSLDIIPLKIYISTENGREYVLSYNPDMGRYFFNRIDRILDIAISDAPVGESMYKDIFDNCNAAEENLWGVSFGGIEEVNCPEHVEMQVHAGVDENFIVQRLEREKRNGTVRKVGDESWLFTADVYDSVEMIPWICSFIGRIEYLKFDNKDAQDKLTEYYEKMVRIYG